MTTKYADEATFTAALREALADDPELLAAALTRLDNAAVDLAPDARVAVYDLSEELELDDEQEARMIDMVVAAALDMGVTEIDESLVREVYGQIYR